MSFAFADDVDSEENSEDIENDEIISETPVYLSSTLQSGTCVLQFPSRPRDRTFTLEKNTEIKIKPNQNK